MFRRRDEEDSAVDAANTEGKNVTQEFGSFMDNKTEAEKKEPVATTAKSVFGINPASAAPAPKEAAPVEEKAGVVEEKPAAAKPVSSIFSKPAATSATKPATYKLSAGGAISSTSNNQSSEKNMSNTDTIETEKRLTVGYGIELEGKISNCDKLIVYGHVQADLTDVKTLHISESGKFSGFAAIDNAEISGTFEGDLIVEDSIVINSTGKMSGKVTYGSIEIKPGGKFTGQIVDASDAAAFDAKAKKPAKKKEAEPVSTNQEEFTLSPEPVQIAEKEEAVA